MSVADNVREAFQGRRGKILLVGGGLAVAAYVVWTRRTGTPEEYESVGDELVPVGSVGRTPQTDPPVGNTEQGTTAPTRPQSNAAWLADGVDFLIGRGTPGAAAHDALTKALGGQQLTTQQIAWVSQVITALGSPPDGMPPLNAAPPPGNPQAPKPPPAETPKPVPTPKQPDLTPRPKTPPTPKPAPGSKRGYGWYQVKRGDSAAAIAKKYGLSLSTFYAYNGPGRIVAGEWVKVRFASNPVFGPYNGK